MQIKNESRDFSRLCSDIRIDIFRIGTAHNSIPVLMEPFVGFPQAFCQGLCIRHELSLHGYIQIVVIIVKAEIGPLGVPIHPDGFQIGANRDCPIPNRKKVVMSTSRSESAKAALLWVSSFCV